MGAFHLTTRVVSDSIEVPVPPELRGKMVEIIIEERAENAIGNSSTDRPLPNAWEEFFAKAESDTIDLDAVIDLRQVSHL